MKSMRALVVVILAGTGPCGAGDSEADVEVTPADPFAMTVGDCFNDTEVGVNEVTEVPSVSCAAPHDNEVFALFDLAPGAFPGDEQVDALAGQGCYDRFEAAIGRSYEESEIAFISMYPTEDSWTRIDDREVVCIAYHMEYEKLTGSVLGSGR